MTETVGFPSSPEPTDPLVPAAAAARRVMGDVIGGQPVLEESGVSPEAVLAGGLSTQLYQKARDLGERTLPLGTQTPYTEKAFYELPKMKDGDPDRTLHTLSLSFDPDIRGVSFSMSSPTMQRVTKLRTATTVPKGSFRAETYVVEGDTSYKIGLDFIAPNPETETPEQILFFDSRYMAKNQTHLPHDDPRRQNVFDQLLSDINLTEQAVAEFEANEGLGEHARPALDFGQEAGRLTSP